MQNILFRERLEGLMAEKGLKSTELGESLGIDGGVIRSWLLYDKNLKLATLMMLSDYFCCSIEYLIGRSENAETILPFPVRRLWKDLKCL